MNRPINHTDTTLFQFLERLKKDKVLSGGDLSDAELLLAERLAEMKLAMKIITLLETFYYYGTPETEDEK